VLKSHCSNNKIKCSKSGILAWSTFLFLFYFDISNAQNLFKQSEIDEISIYGKAPGYAVVPNVKCIQSGSVQDQYLEQIHILDSNWLGGERREFLRYDGIENDNIFVFRSHGFFEKLPGKFFHDLLAFRLESELLHEEKVLISFRICWFDGSFNTNNLFCHLYNKKEASRFIDNHEFNYDTIFSWSRNDTSYFPRDKFETIEFIYTALGQEQFVFIGSNDFRLRIKRNEKIKRNYDLDGYKTQMCRIGLVDFKVLPYTFVDSLSIFYEKGKYLLSINDSISLISNLNKMEYLIDSITVQGFSDTFKLANSFNNLELAERRSNEIRSFLQRINADAKVISLAPKVLNNEKKRKSTVIFYYHVKLE